jgi:S1-C subfamily serine protease
VNGTAAGPVFGLILLATSPCLRAQAVPSLDRFDSETRQSLELTCLISRTEGPAAYGGCLNGHIEALRTSPPVPDLAKLDDATRRSVQLACVIEKRQGPALYARCLNGEIAALRRSPRAPSLSGPASLAGRAPAFPLLQWSGVQKPAMPSQTRSAASPPDALFGVLEKSVYVLVSAPSLQSLKAGAGKQGSAVAISSNVALTNCHVLQGNRVHFLVKDRSLLAATMSYGDERSDRCAVEVKAGALSPIQGIRRYSTLVVGERVYAVGSPSGLENTLSEGILSGLRKRAGLDLVQISAPISPGSSGGGLFDAAGNLIGITTFLLRDSQNLNFAIAADAYWR